MDAADVRTVPAYAQSAVVPELQVGRYRVRSLVRVAQETGFLQGYSFTFEVKRGGDWIAYGPQCLGNWSIRTSVTREILPRHVLPGDPEDTDTIPLGWWALEEALRATGSRWEGDVVDEAVPAHELPNSEVPR